MWGEQWGFWGGGPTHGTGCQLPVEGLGPPQDVLHAQLHGELVDVLREKGASGPPAPQHSAAASATLCHTTEARQMGTALPGLPVGAGGRGSALRMPRTRTEKNTELHPHVPGLAGLGTTGREPAHARTTCFVGTPLGPGGKMGQEKKSWSHDCQAQGYPHLQAYFEH